MSWPGRPRARWRGCGCGAVWCWPRPRHAAAFIKVGARSVRQQKLVIMLTEAVACVSVAAVVIGTPGPDTALTIRSAVAGGRTRTPWDACLSDWAFASPPTSVDSKLVRASGIKRTRADRELDRRIAALALPALGSIAAEPAYSLADTAIAGHLGRAPLDSLAIATTALTMTAWVAIFLTTATTSEVAGLAAGRTTGRAARAAAAAYPWPAGSGPGFALPLLLAAPGVARVLAAQACALF